MSFHINVAGVLAELTPYTQVMYLRCSLGGTDSISSDIASMSTSILLSSITRSMSLCRLAYQNFDSEAGYHSRSQDSRFTLVFNDQTKKP